MRENESEFQPASTDGETDPAGTWGTNGSAPATEEDGSDAPTGEPSPASADATDDATGDPTANASDDDSTAFLADLARVMQAAAGAERLRISEDGERRRNAHLDLIRARETSEAEEQQVLAEGDVKAIDAWADTEIERIQSERERRITGRRGELAQRLEDHRLLIGREVDAVEAAIAAYRTEVDVYFSQLEAETDPVAIAREAGMRPQFPDLGTAGPNGAPAGVATSPSGQAGPAGDDEPSPAGDALTGVMGSDAPAEAIEGDEGAAPTADVEPVASIEPAAGVESPDEPGEPAETKAQSVETTVVPNAVAPRSSAALLQAVPTLRPMGSWFRRAGDAGSHPDTDA
jgi:hypothetical protein